MDLQEIKQSRFKIKRERQGSIAPTKDTLIQLAKLAKKSVSVATEDDKSYHGIEETHSHPAATLEGYNLESEGDSAVPNFS